MAALVALLTGLAGAAVTFVTGVLSNKVVQWFAAIFLAVLLGKAIISTAGTTLVQGSDDISHSGGNLTGGFIAWIERSWHEVLGRDICVDPYIRYGNHCRISPEKMRKFETTSRAATDGSTGAGFVCPEFAELPTTPLINEDQACKYIGPVKAAKVPLGFTAEYDDAGTTRQADPDVLITTGEATFRPK